MSSNFFDCLIIGCGGSGLSIAYYLLKSHPNARICITSNSYLNNTSMAQGGISSVLKEIQDDTPEYHIYDTIKGGDWLGDHDSIKYMCEESSDVIKDLIYMGINFDTDQNNKLLRKKYGGHTIGFGKNFAERVISCKDQTGKHIYNALFEQVRNKVLILNNHLAINLIINENNCYGSVFLDTSKNKILSINSKNTIIATGGYSSIYKSSTSSISKGTANRLAITSGLSLQDMEFVQFHPTALPNGKLVSEAARSLGGVLLNSNLESFMYKYAPKNLELATRDIVSRAIVQEMLNTNSSNVFLSLKHLDNNDLRQKLPLLIENCRLEYNIDPTKDLIPIKPAAHYTMGGIPTNALQQVIDYNLDKKSIVNNLYAIGESSCASVHGANRLGCNSLIEIITSAKIASRSIAERNFEDTIQISNLEKINREFEKKFIEKYLNSDKEDFVEKMDFIEFSMKDNNDKNANCIRNKENLEYGFTVTKNLINDLSKIKLTSNSKALLVLKYIELESMLITSRSVYYCALNRLESRGSHYMTDYKKRDDYNYRYHSIYKYSEEDVYEKKELRTIDCYEKKFPPEENRVY